MWSSGGFQVNVFKLQCLVSPGQDIDHPIVIKDSNSKEDSGDNVDFEMVVEDEISLWSWKVNSGDGWILSETLVRDRIVYNLVPIEEVHR
jgi:hypothetical protein